eukprot:7004950-Prorocentrum_lima.AAC.1
MGRSLEPETAVAAAVEAACVRGVAGTGGVRVRVHPQRVPCAGRLRRHTHARGCAAVQAPTAGGRR